MDTAADPNRHRHGQLRMPERRKTRTLTVSPWVKGILIAAATSTLISLPAICWRAAKAMRVIDSGMQAVERMAKDYKTTREQGVLIQIQLNRLTDAVNDLRREKGLAPIPQQAIIGATPAEARGGNGRRAPEIQAAFLNAARGASK